MTMSKDEMVSILKQCFSCVNEGVTPASKDAKQPRAVYWDYIWDDISGSGEDYEDLNTYQISVFSLTPPQQTQELCDLRRKLREAGEHPVIYHEFVQEDKIWHSYMSLEVAE